MANVRKQFASHGIWLSKSKVCVQRAGVGNRDFEFNFSCREPCLPHSKNCCRAYGCAYLWSRIDGELQLGFLSIIHTESLHEESRQTGSRPSSEAVEDQKSLESRAVVGDLPDFVQRGIDDLFSNCVMTSGIIIGRIFLQNKIS